MALPAVRCYIHLHSLLALGWCLLDLPNPTPVLTPPHPEATLFVCLFTWLLTVFLCVLASRSLQVWKLKLGYWFIVFCAAHAAQVAWYFFCSFF